MKKLTILILFLGIIFGYYFFDSLINNPSQVIPFPYTFDEKILDSQELSQAQASHILILGDSQAVSLDKYLKPKLSKFEDKIQNDLIIYNWSKENEGIHRSLHKLSSLKIVPPVVIFLGGADEFHEKTFNLKNIKEINKNFKLYQNTKIQSLIFLAPILSKFIYKEIKYIKMNKKILPDSNVYTARARQVYYKLRYYLYEHQISELINTCRKNESQLILISNPINYLLPPVNECENTYTHDLFEKLTSIEQNIKDSHFKDSISELEVLKQNIPANAKIEYLLGQSHLKMGNNLKAKKYFKYAKAYDCDPINSSPILNSIKEQKSTLYKTYFLDFDKILSQNLGKDYLFITRKIPQNIYYERMVDQLMPLITTGLNL